MAPMASKVRFAEMQVGSDTGHLEILAAEGWLFCNSSRLDFRDVHQQAFRHSL